MFCTLSLMLTIMDGPLVIFCFYILIHDYTLYALLVLLVAVLPQLHLYMTRLVIHLTNEELCKWSLLATSDIILTK